MSDFYIFFSRFLQHFVTITAIRQGGVRGKWTAGADGRSADDRHLGLPLPVFAAILF